MPMKKGSAVVVVSRHIRGSIEAISKIKRFTISSAKIIKKRLQDNKATRQQVLFDFGEKKKQAVYVRYPQRSELNAEINKSLIVEYYSRV